MVCLILSLTPGFRSFCFNNSLNELTDFFSCNLSITSAMASCMMGESCCMMDFINPFNDATRDMQGKTVTAHITIYDDRTMDFRVVAEPTDDRIRAALGIQKGSGRPNTEKISKKLSQADLRKIAEEKAVDMNTDDVEAVMKMVAGTARSMGVEVEA